MSWNTSSGSRAGYTTMHDRHLLVEQHGVDHIEDVGVDVILGIEDGHHLVAGAPQAYIETMGLVDGSVLEGKHAHVPDSLTTQLRDLLLGLLDGSGVVDRANHHHLQ